MSRSTSWRGCGRCGARRPSAGSSIGCGRRLRSRSSPASTPTSSFSTRRCSVARTPASTVDYAELFGFPYEAAALYDGAWGNAILSRHPIARSQELRIYNRGGLTAVIDTPAGQLTVASYHPHPHREPKNKALDFTQLVTGLSGPLIVCGDLNCISPEDGVDRDQLIEAFRGFSSEAEWAVNQFIDSGKLVFASLGKLGLKDAIPPAGRRYSIPTDLINLDKRSGMRIDHILANDAIEVVSGEVVHSPASNAASDHHPVMVEFRIRPS